MRHYCTVMQYHPGKIYFKTCQGASYGENTKMASIHALKMELIERKKERKNESQGEILHLEITQVWFFFTLTRKQITEG